MELQPVYSTQMFSESTQYLCCNSKLSSSLHTVWKDIYLPGLRSRYKGTGKDLSQSDGSDRHCESELIIMVRNKVQKSISYMLKRSS